MATKNLGKIAFLYRGDYFSGTTYQKNDVVFDGESSYISFVNNNTGNSLTNINYWKYLSRGNYLAEQQNADSIAQLETDLSYMYPSVGTAKRVLADAGTIKSRSTLNDLTNKFLDLLPNTKLLFCPHLAVKLRESGIYKYVTKLYDVGPAMLDAAQTTALSQPYLSGNIAPNEKYSIKNPNGGNTYLTHTPISFSATDKWSVTTMLNDFCSSLADFGAYCGNGTAASNIYTRKASQNRLRFLSNTSIEYLFNLNNSLIGKNTLLTLTALGNGTLNLFINGTLFQSITSTDTSFIFSRLVNGYSTFGLNGIIHYHAIRNIALTPAQVQDEYTYLRTLFQEVESVQIGTQTWATSNCEMTSTPQGYLINEMQTAANVEKITNVADREFSSDTGFWTKNGNWTISGGYIEFTGGTGTGTLVKNGLLTIGKRFKIRLKVDAVNGAIVFNNGDFSSHPLSERQIKIGINDYYLISTTGIFTIAAPSNLPTDYIKIDSVSVEEVGWSDSTNLYDYVYANTSGTAEQKEYAAVKAAAMWCYYNNDPAIGSVYGKLYNWYAVRLIDMDITYYNVANPTATWGWRVPTTTDFTTLQTFLGGESVAGGKMKKEGLSYWSSSNTGATNESGFSAIGSGIRVANGSFANMLNTAWFMNTSLVGRVCRSASDSLDISSTLVLNSGINGGVLRLIKA